MADQLPAQYEDVLAVSRVDELDKLEDVKASVRSRRHKYVDVGAPGTSILSTVRPERIRCGFLWLKSCGMGGTDTKNGTSMAAPMVSGVVAHMKARYPDATVRQIATALFRTAYNPDVDPRCRGEYTPAPLKCRTDDLGHGLVRPLDAIAYLGRLVGASSSTKIAFVSDRSGTAQIHTMNADGSEEQQITRSAGSKYDPSWSPDGSRIAFESSSSDILVINFDGSGERRLSDDDAKHHDPAWSPEGERIAFSRKLGNHRCGFPLAKHL